MGDHPSTSVCKGGVALSAENLFEAVELFEVENPEGDALERPGRAVDRWSTSIRLNRLGVSAVAATTSNL